MSWIVSTQDDQPASRSASRADAGQPVPARLDAASRRWLEQLRAGHPRHDEAVLRLHELLRRIAFHELSRRRPQLRAVSGPEFDDLAHQAADDALELLAQAIAELTERQRAVFVAVALNDVSIDVVAVELGTNRNAVYKNLFDARRRLRRRLAAAGLPVTGE